MKNEVDLSHALSGDRSSPETQMMDDDSALHKSSQQPSGVLVMGTTPLKSSQSYATVRLSEAMAIGKTLDAAQSLLAISGERSLGGTQPTEEQSKKWVDGETGPPLQQEPCHHVQETHGARNSTKRKSPSPACQDELGGRTAEAMTRSSPATAFDQAEAAPTERGARAVPDDRNCLHAGARGSEACQRQLPGSRLPDLSAAAIEAALLLQKEEQAEQEAKTAIGVNQDERRTGIKREPIARSVPSIEEMSAKFHCRISPASYGNIKFVFEKFQELEGDGIILCHRKENEAENSVLGFSNFDVPDCVVFNRRCREIAAEMATRRGRNPQQLKQPTEVLNNVLRECGIHAVRGTRGPSATDPGSRDFLYSKRYQFSKERQLKLRHKVMVNGYTPEIKNLSREDPGKFLAVKLSKKAFKGEASKGPVAAKQHVSAAAAAHAAVPPPGDSNYEDECVCAAEILSNLLGSPSDQASHTKPKAKKPRLDRCLEGGSGSINTAKEPTDVGKNPSVLP